MRDLKWVIFDTDETQLYALKFAKGCYQTALLRGYEAWSGSTLRGKAAKWSLQYRKSRCSLIRRMEQAGLICSYETMPDRRNKVMRILAVSR